MSFDDLFRKDRPNKTLQLTLSGPVGPATKWAIACKCDNGNLTNQDRIRQTLRSGDEQRQVNGNFMADSSHIFGRIERLIRENSDGVNFGDPDAAPGDAAMQAAEKLLGVKLPPSYQWWLKNYGGGEVNHQIEEIYSIYSGKFLDTEDGDVVVNARRTAKRGIRATERIYLCRPGNDEEYFFRPDLADDRGEFPVFVTHLDSNNEEEKYADSFAEFLLLRLLYYFS